MVTIINTMVSVNSIYKYLIIHLPHDEVNHPCDHLAEAAEKVQHHLSFFAQPSEDHSKNDRESDDS